MTILTAVKKLLGLDEEYTQFDQDVILNINMALNTLTQLGVGPKEGFRITKNETLEDFVGDDVMFDQIINYLYLRTRIIFDPPSSSYVLEAYKEQIVELESRLIYHVQSIKEEEDDLLSISSRGERTEVGD